MRGSPHQRLARRSPPAGIRRRGPPNGSGRRAHAPPGGIWLWRGVAGGAQGGWDGAHCGEGVDVGEGVGLARNEGLEGVAQGVEAGVGRQAWGGREVGALALGGGLKVC